MIDTIPRSKLFVMVRLSLTCLLGAVIHIATVVIAAESSLKINTDRADAQYHQGETAAFEIEVNPANDQPAPAKVLCVLSQDGWNFQPAREVALKDGHATVTGTLDKPGFLQLRVSVPGTKLAALAGAAFDPLQIKPSLPAPDDFDAFWTGQKQRLAAVPVKSRLTPAKSPVKGVDAFDLQVDSLGAPVSGYYGRPAGAKPKSLPAILFVHGAGVRSSNLGSVAWAGQQGGMLSLDINAHGIPNGKPQAYYDDLANTTLKDYRYVGRADRHKSYFLGMFLRELRAIDFLTSQPEWDGKTLIVYGSSQGGFQALVAGGLDERVSFFCAGVPAGCDHTGIMADRINGWPKLVTITNGKPDAEELQTARYFDTVNFARRSKAKGAVLTVGFIDTTCPPTSVYAAYNALTIPKEIHTDVLSGHTNTPAASKFMQEAAYAHIRAMKGAP
jgi:cephalosporin-C deacetylase-like acetyl esterase